MKSPAMRVTMRSTWRTSLNCSTTLVAGGAVERLPAVGADLRMDAECAEQRERAPRDCRAAEIEMDRDPSAAKQVDAARRMEKRRELREPVATASRRDRGELVPQVLREWHGPRAEAGAA